jgi:aspartate kinase
VKTADPEVVPDARTLPVISYEEVANMAHQGAKVLHPRAAEIAMLHQIPLWVKSSFERAPGTLVAPLTEVDPPTKHGITGLATISNLVYFTMTGLAPDQRAAVECEVYQAIGEAGISFYLNSVGPETSSFLVDQSAAARVEPMLRERAIAYEVAPDCELVSVVAVNMWEEPGFLQSIAQVLFGAGISMLQFADTEGSVSCLVARSDARAAVQALHQRFALGR